MSIAVLCKFSWMKTYRFFSDPWTTLALLALCSRRKYGINIDQPALVRRCLRCSNLIKTHVLNPAAHRSLPRRYFSYWYSAVALPRWSAASIVIINLPTLGRPARGGPVINRGGSILGKNTGMRSKSRVRRSMHSGDTSSQASGDQYQEVFDTHK